MAKHHALKRSEKSGLPPGAAITVSKVPKYEKARISMIRFSAEQVSELGEIAVDACIPDTQAGETVWINVDGVHEPELVEKICHNFSLHPLSTEDILNTVIRPKEEDYGSYLLVILKMVVKANANLKGMACFSTEQVSIVLGPAWVITFQENHAGDVFDNVRNRLRSGKGKMRASGADYLAYALMDAVVDGYFVVLEELGEEIETIESQVTNSSGSPMLTEIHASRNFGLFLRRHVWPVRDMLAGLERNDSPLFKPPTRIYLRDVYDHAVEIMEMLEAYRDMAAGLMELHLSATSNRMNSVMMVLTTVTTIFMPLTFIVGLYGMNFQFMPELHWRYGYPLVLAIMAVIAVCMLIAFRKRKWI